MQLITPLVLCTSSLLAFTSLRLVLCKGLEAGMSTGADRVLVVLVSVFIFRVDDEVLNCFTVSSGFVSCKCKLLSQVLSTGICLLKLI